MKPILPKPKFKVGDKVIIDDLDTGTIAKCGFFQKDDGIYVYYKLTENFLPGFWAQEDRLKIKT
jgi:hypothetical protein